MGMQLIFRVNGVTPAWPVELGGAQTTRASMRLSGEPLSMANTAFSLILKENDAEIYHLLVDVGLGVVNALLQFSLTRPGCRPPDAVLLTHSHFDHIAGLDWLVNSVRRHPFPPPAQPPAFPVYCTQGCWDIVKGKVFSWLPLSHKKLVYGEPVAVHSCLTLIPLPVYHGPSAPEATMVVVQYQGQQAEHRLVLTGDLLVPLWPDHTALQQRPDYVFIDANTRYPAPASGHLSLTDAAFLELGKLQVQGVAHPRQRLAGLQDPLGVLTLAEVAAAAKYQPPHSLRDLPATGLELLRRWNPTQGFYLTHYSGYEDRQLGRSVLPDLDLVLWAREEAARKQIPAPDRIDIAVPGLKIVLE